MTNHPELCVTCVECLAVAGLGDKKDPELAAFWGKCEAGGLAKIGTLLYFHYPLFNNRGERGLPVRRWVL